MTVQLAPRLPRPAAAPVFRSDVNVFGEVDGGSHDPRILVPRTVYLSFAEILGMVALGSVLTWEELTDESEVLRAVQYCLVDHTGPRIQENAARAMALLGGCTEDPEEARFVAHVAMVVTRVFGITPPALPDASTALVAVRTDVDINGEMDPCNSAPRIAVSAPLWMSLAELVGLLALSPGLGLVEEELDNDALVRLFVSVVITEGTWDRIDALADRARAIRSGQVTDPDAWFVAAVVPVVARVFGIAA